MWNSPAARRGLPVLVLLMPLCGCALLRTVGIFPAEWERAEVVERHESALPPIPKSRNSFEIDVVFVERPVGDPQLGQELWKNLAQLAEIPPATREAISQSGFRIASCGSTPPLALQEMLADTAEEVRMIRASSDRTISPTLTAHRVTLQDGSETEIQASPVYPHCTLSFPTADGTSIRDYDSARCLFRVDAQRVQNGWARLEFVPEIHYGEMKLRHVAGPNGFVLKTTQKVDPLTAQRFAVTLNLGEMIVLSCEPGPAHSPGRRFFVGADDDANMQRLIIVRLTSMGKSAPLYAE